MSQPAPYETLFVARQPVLDECLGTWGYFHYYRRCQEHTYSEFSDPMQATLCVIQCLPACMETCALGHKAIINLPPQALTVGIPRALGPGCLAPLLEGAAGLGAEHLNILRELRADGFRITVDLHRPFDFSSPLLELADTVVLDMRSPSQGLPELRQTVKTLLAKGKRLLAKRVETHETMSLAREMGFTLFSGHFFREPVTLSQRKISAVEATKLAIFSLLAQQEPPVDQLVTAIEADASVAYRVLTLVNSPHFGLVKKVTSIRQAVLLAGWKQLSSWLRVLLLSDAIPSTKARELLHLSAQRGKFFELLAQASGRAEQAEELFLLGILSLLPAMLDTPMETLLKPIALADELADALCGRQGPLSPWLAMAQSIEDTRWDDMANLALELNLPAGSVATAYNASFQWADKLMRAMPAKPGNGHSGGGACHS